MTCALLLALSCLQPKPTFTHGLPQDPKFFPIAVWLQEPANAPKFQAAGFNLYVGLWAGPTEEQLETLKKFHMPVICEQNEVGLKHNDDPTIVGWMHGDEPDNAQEVKDPKTGQTVYGPCIPPQQIVDEYHAFQAKDPTRPVMLNLGQGVANDDWYGRGNGSSLKDYETYVKGGDIISFDIYPVAGLPKPDPENYLWYVPKGLDRLASWTKGQPTSLWNCIECTRIDGGKKATPAQVRTEVWMSLIHGSHGLIYFVHQFKPTFDEHALLDDPEMLPAVTALNHQVKVLAPALNAQSLPDRLEVKSAKASAPIDAVLKKVGQTLYILSVGMRNESTTGLFQIHQLRGHHQATAIGEGRAIEVKNGKFSDHFAPYEVHLYKIEN